MQGISNGNKEISEFLKAYLTAAVEVGSDIYSPETVLNNEKHDCRDYPSSSLGADLTARIPPHLSLLYNFTAPAAK